MDDPNRTVVPVASGAKFAYVAAPGARPGKLHVVPKSQVKAAEHYGPFGRTAVALCGRRGHYSGARPAASFKDVCRDCRAETRRES